MTEESETHRQWRKNISKAMKLIWQRRKREAEIKEELFQEQMAKQGGYEKP